MFWNKLYQRLQRFWSRLFKKSAHPQTVLDTVHLNLWGLTIDLSRELTAGIPYELTVVIPRTELRQTGADHSCGLDINLNSITIAHSPRFEGTEPSVPPILPRPDRPNAS